MAHLLVVDDEESIIWAFRQMASDMHVSVDTAASAEAGLEAARQHPPDVLLLDVRLPGIDGLTAMGQFRSYMQDSPIIVMTAFGGLDTAVDAMRQGAFEYLVKPFDVATAQEAIERALKQSQLAQAPAKPERPHEFRGPMVGTSPAIQHVFKNIALVAPSEACVHIFGESGTGKELVARAIHQYSPRSKGPFVPINVASLSHTLAESELFGHTQGSFTGADRGRVGLLVEASGGTVFLDEIADVPPPLQVKLLRALEHGEVWPVGSDRPVKTDFRLISATHRDLQECVANKEFRHDLYYRLMTFVIDVPPLRARPGDILELAESFLQQFAQGKQASSAMFSEQTRQELERRIWYGNVRELRNAIEHSVIRARGGMIMPQHLPPASPAPAELNLDRDPPLQRMLESWAEERLAHKDTDNLYEQLLALVEPPLLKAAMQAAGGQNVAAARLLGIHRGTLRKKLEQHGLQRDSGDYDES